MPVTVTAETAAIGFTSYTVPGDYTVTKVTRVKM